MWCKCNASCAFPSYDISASHRFINGRMPVTFIFFLMPAALSSRFKCSDSALNQMMPSWPAFFLAVGTTVCNLRLGTRES
jgi:hypothetical protein